jgi:hypothetical protein
MTDNILHSETTARGIASTVWLTRSTDGGVVIAGQDLGDLAWFWGPGAREYEWGHSVAAQQLPALIRSLGGSDDDDVEDLVRTRFSGSRHAEFASFCKEHDIEVRSWSRFGG